MEKLSPVSIQDQSDSGWQLDDTTRAVFVKLLSTGTPLDDAVLGRMYRGVLTGLNDAFILDQATRDRLLAMDANSQKLIKPLLRGSDLRPWYQENEGRWLIVIPSGWTSKTFGVGLTEEEAWSNFQRHYSSVASYLQTFAEAARKRLDKGEYWWELRSCNYYDEFEAPKVFWPDIAKIPRFSWDATGFYVNDKGFFVVPEHPYILGVLQSRASWLCISKLCVPLGERAGLIRYQHKSQFISRLPIPQASDETKDTIGGLAMSITEHANARYTLHHRARHRILSDLGTPDHSLNQKLTSWWELDFPAFRREIQKVFKHDIPLKTRDEWEEWLDAQHAVHQRHTTEIIRLETALNQHVYTLFDLTPAEIQIIETSTKYRYGEV
ncbi:MAG TPA: hypothetical protein VF707_04465 [Ardenticatenaceae bacterium]